MYLKGKGQVVDGAVGGVRELGERRGRLGGGVPREGVVRGGLRVGVALLLAACALLPGLPYRPALLLHHRRSQQVARLASAGQHCDMLQLVCHSKA